MAAQARDRDAHPETPSRTASRPLRKVLRHSWRLHLRTRHTIAEIAQKINPIVRGWLQYYEASIARRRSPWSVQRLPDGGIRQKHRQLTTVK